MGKRKSLVRDSSSFPASLSSSNHGTALSHHWPGGIPLVVIVLPSGPWRGLFEGGRYLVAVGAVICLGAPLEDKCWGPGSDRI
jgi:hypothetical protein